MANSISCLTILNISSLSKNVYHARGSAGNQRHPYSLVGTSETTRAASYPEPFCEWLAGLIDGDGCLLVSKQGYTSCEITISIADERCIRFLLYKLGGAIKIRSGARAWRYRLHNKAGIIKLIHCINGHIRHTTRIKQHHRVCLELNITPISPAPLTWQKGWFAGFFDAEGTLTFSMKDHRPKLSLRVVNKQLADVQHYLSLFGGVINYDTSQNGYYYWSVQSREDVFMMLNYFNHHPCRSAKFHRLHLVTRYYELCDLKAYIPCSKTNKAWQSFLTEWNKMKI